MARNGGNPFIYTFVFTESFVPLVSYSLFRLVTYCICATSGQHLKKVNNSAFDFILYSYCQLLREKWVPISQKFFFILIFQVSSVIYSLLLFILTLIGCVTQHNYCRVLVEIVEWLCTGRDIMPRSESDRWSRPQITDWYRGPTELVQHSLGGVHIVARALLVRFNSPFPLPCVKVQYIHCVAGRG
jgi:hypothetical protein